jgi:hypothetical protein
VTLAALLIAVGLLAFVNSVSGWELGPTAFFGTALLVVGLGLVAAAFTSGRTARGALVALGVVLSLGTIAAASEPWRGHEGHVGDQTFRADSAEEVRPLYDCGFGNCRVDLSDVDVSDLDDRITTKVDAGVGHVEVIVPRSADVEVTVDSGIGDVRVLDGEQRDGDLFPGFGSGSWIDGEPEIALTIDAGMGEVEVSRG